MIFDFRRLPRAPQANANNLRCAGLSVLAVLALAGSPASAKEPAIAPTTREAEHFKAFDAAIAPVRGYDLSADEAAKIRDAIKAITARDITKALDLRAGIKDPIGLKLVNWYRLRGGYGQIGEYKTFLAENPAWPERGILNQRFEELLFSEGGNATSIKAHFQDAEPKNGIGWAALASADMALGDTEAAKTRAVKIWRDMTIPPNYEQGFIERFGKFLTVADHKWRLDRLLIDDIRWAADRTDRASAIQRQIARLPADHQKLAEARLAVFMKDDDAKYDMAKVMYDAAKTDYGFLYHRIQLLRRANKIDDAAKLLLTIPVDPKVVSNLDEWWAERRILAYAALNAGKTKLAYDLVRNAGPLGVNPAKEQAFMAGWLAMRFLKDNTAAVAHFTAAAKAADGPLSRSRSAYWLGRIAEQAGEKSKAADHYRQAAKEIDTFYGQLAQLKLDPNNRRIEIKMPAPPSAAQIRRFNELDAVKAVVVARKSGLDIGITRNLIAHLKTYFDNETDVAMAAHLADAIGDTQLALRSSKTAVARGQNMLVYAYPVHTFPSFTPLSTPPETAFLLGITRQETEFNKDTVSGAGAKGLMQVMTITAQHVCKDHKITCELDRLLPDSAYNAKIASAYIGDRMREFGGSYILGLSGYNAGPGRSREWIRAFGDPRDPKMDPVDWIERIPFQETREYVSKVLSNIQIYRARLGDEANALQLDRDLLRGRAKTAPNG
ncbi:MAG: lytic transglycosylase domain-containing protein [Hyphomicrobiaceae bacterium]